MSPRRPSFFHALVVLGAGVSATDCGGVAKSDTGSSDGDGAAGTGGKAAGGAATSDASPSSGGAGGADGTGGSANTGGSYPPDGGHPDAATLAQWNCASVGYCLYSGATQELNLSPDTPCPVESTRPRQESDCAPGEWFDCIAARWNQEEPIRVNCTCTPKADSGCGTCPTPICDGSSRTCGCAHPVILI